MAKTFVTFGQDHVHQIEDKIIDKDCVAVINCDSAEHGRQLAFEIFGKRFCFEYPEKYFNGKEQMKYFHRGFINVN